MNFIESKGQLVHAFVVDLQLSDLDLAFSGKGEKIIGINEVLCCWLLVELMKKRIKTSGRC